MEDVEYYKFHCGILVDEPVAPSIGRMIEAIQNAAVVWKTLSNMYSGEGNVMMMVEAQNKVENLKQERRTVKEYASELQQLWANLDHYDPLQLKHEDDIVIGNKWLQRRRVIHFLKGLNKEFEDRSVTPGNSLVISELICA
uniref:Retrotransposon protein, putative, unclassified n=1 Tax=Oryza sativa subsp. japonica TaxID=39947 RepID=Q2R2E3_ORYSJ|nr:retrotransposon protein, putative, unclassified [Oryza sativa Japonica Group]